MEDFNLKKFLIENKMTRNSRLLAEFDEGDENLQNTYDSSPKMIPWDVIEKAYQKSGLTGEEFFADFEDEFRNQFEDKSVSKEAYFNFYADRSVGGQDDKYIMANWVDITGGGLA